MPRAAFLVHRFGAGFKTLEKFFRVPVLGVVVLDEAGIDPACDHEPAAIVCGEYQTQQALARTVAHGSEHRPGLRHRDEDLPGGEAKDRLVRELHFRRSGSRDLARGDECRIEFGLPSVLGERRGRNDQRQQAGDSGDDSHAALLRLLRA